MTTLTATLDEAQIKQALFTILGRIAPEADFESLRPTEDIRQALDIDSFDYLNFLIGVHDELGVDIPESDYGKLGTLRDLVQYISARVR